MLFLWFFTLLCFALSALCWLRGTCVRKIHCLLRTDVLVSKHPARQLPLLSLWPLRISRRRIRFKRFPYHPCRVRGQVLFAQEHQPLPTERSMHPFDALRSPRVPSLVSQCGRYAMSDSFMLSYFP